MSRLERLMHVATKYSRRIIGLMSGTSLDAIDVAMVRIQKHGLNATVKLEHFRSYPYPAKIRGVVRELFDPKRARIDDICRYDFILGEVFAAAVLRLLQETRIKPESVDLIASAGQTIWHDPELSIVNADVDWIDAPISTRSTFAIGQSAVIAERTGIITVGDLRVRDVAAGGQGAPLVPAFHVHAFARPGVHRVIANIGGIANVTDLPATGPVRGWDTGPGNMLLDSWIQRHHGDRYDRGGAWAQSGKVDGHLLETLLDHDYLRQAPPKSAGREQFNLGWLDATLQKLGRTVSPVDVQATLVELTATSLAEGIDRECPGALEVYVCGGGAHNVVLMQHLRTRLPGVKVETTGGLGIDPDWVEALAFAWLARQTVHRAPGNLPSVTGARGPRVLGAIYPA